MTKIINVDLNTGVSSRLAFIWYLINLLLLLSKLKVTKIRFFKIGFIKSMVFLI